MKVLTDKISVILKLSIVLMVSIVVFIDEDTLNSFVFQHNNTVDFVVEEVSTVVVNKGSNVQLMGQVVVNDIETESDNNVVVDYAQTDYWAWPTNDNYVITSYYGARWGSTHKAIDISGTGYGSNIYAANNGVVVTARGGCRSGNLSCNGKGGNYIVINHNSDNYYTVYMHLKDINVNVGDVVSRGQVIGTMGNTGNVVPAPTTSNPYSGTHLHFALYIGEPYKGGYAVNPMRLY